MCLHHRADHLRGKFQESFGDGALQNPRVFHQIHELLKQRLGAIGCPISSGGSLGHLLANQRSAAVAVNHHPHRCECLGIGIGRGDLHGPTLMEAMSSAEPITTNLGIRTSEGDRNHIRSLKGDQPTDRTTEALSTGSPTHKATPLQRIDPARNQIFQKITAGLARRSNRGKQARAFRCFPLLKCRRLNTASLGETDGRRARLAILERLCHRWALAILLKVRLSLLKLFHGDHKSARGAEHRNAAVVQASFLEVTGDPLPQLSQPLTNKIGGKFLGADLKKKGCRHATSRAAGDCIGSRFATVIPDTSMTVGGRLLGRG